MILGYHQSILSDSPALGHQNSRDRYFHLKTANFLWRNVTTPSLTVSHIFTRGSGRSLEVGEGLMMVVIYIVWQTAELDTILASDCIINGHDAPSCNWTAVCAPCIYVHFNSRRSVVAVISGKLGSSLSSRKSVASIDNASGLNRYRILQHLWWVTQSLDFRFGVEVVPHFCATGSCVSRSDWCLDSRLFSF